MRIVYITIIIMAIYGISYGIVHWKCGRDGSIDIPIEGGHAIALTYEIDVSQLSRNVTVQKCVVVIFWPAYKIESLFRNEYLFLMSQSPNQSLKPSP